MSDSDLRDLERRFRASGSVEDEAAWLRARLQHGALEPDRVEVAACLGAPAAALLCSTRALPPRFSSGLVSGRRETWPRSASERRAQPSPLLAVFGATPGDLYEPGLDLSLRRSEWDTWLLDAALPPDCLRRVAAAVARLAFRAYANGRTYSQEEWVTEEVRALEVAVFTGADDYVLKGEGAESAAFEARGTKAQLPAEAVASACAAFRGEHRSELVLAAAKAAGPYGARFRAALGEEVVPWALNYADPVRERAGSRPSEVVGG